MKLKFDGNQPYQLEAIRAVTDLFTGQPSAAGRSEVARGSAWSGLGFANVLALSDAALLANLQAVQGRNALGVSEELGGRNFTVEMETGTGKTYVYLRTILELNRRCGFKKFIIVVPSVAIREGVLKSLELTREHFALLFNVPYNAFVYDPKRLSQIRSFGVNNTLQIMIMNIDAFNKDNNVIRRNEDALSGRRPLDFIQETSPVVVMDEPQNMESGRAQKAIQGLNPLCTLRYSATHRNLYNLVYKLDPIRAYDLKLVKLIEVSSVTEDAAFNKPYIAVKGFKAYKSKPPTAQLELDVLQRAGVKRKTLTVKGDDDLFEKTERDLYRDHIVSEIHAGEERVSFSNGVSLYLGQAHGNNKDAIMQAQVRETVKEHLDKEARISRLLEGQRLKVLSLFFIDKVANYADKNGKIRRWFIEAYSEFTALPKYKGLNLPPAERVHNGYFATTNSGEAKDTSGRTKADDDAYRLIMQAKEELLDTKTPLRFIFSHSALREGWDNPNVFQICTLNESKSDIKKRQEIGRGLRLPVLETGERSFDESINVLSVVANESYADFAKALQNEILAETGVKIGRDRIKNKRERQAVTLNKQVYLSPEFRVLWDRIGRKTRYTVHYGANELIRVAAVAVSELPPVTAPKVSVQKGRLQRGDLAPVRVAARSEVQAGPNFAVPDVLGILQRETELTRSTLAAILKASGRVGDLLVNPQAFIDGSVRAVQRVLQELMVESAEYAPSPGEAFEMKRLELDAPSGYLSNMERVQKSVHEWVVYGSEVELKFVKSLEERRDIRLYVKLPSWFKVETPVGPYNPGWAIVKEASPSYLICETKSAADSKLKASQRHKLRCGEAHFGALGVRYKVVDDPGQV